MEKPQSECPHPGCFFCVTKESNPLKRRSAISKFFRDLPSLPDDDSGQVLPISGLWNAAMSRPNDPEFVDSGVFECMSSLISKSFRNRRWLSHDQNIFIPYYAAHIIGSYTMNLEPFAARAVHAGVIPPLVELLRGRLTWVEQRVAVRALGHLATYPSTFPAVAAHGEVLELAIQLASDSLDIVYSRFYRNRQPAYHCDLLTRGIGGAQMESRKAEEWASQIQCWSLQLVNCFAFKPEFLPEICKPEFLAQLPAMWGGLVNESSPAGIGLLRTICQQKLGRAHVAAVPVVIDSLCSVARSSDDWQFMAVDCLLWLLQDPTTRPKVVDKAAVALADLSELSELGDRKQLGDDILAVFQQCLSSLGTHASAIKKLLEEAVDGRQHARWEKSMPKEDLHIKQAAALVVKLEGNSLFSSGDIAGAAAKYSEALELCPAKSRKERAVLYSNRAQCHLLLQKPQAAVSDATRALCLGRHAKSLWRRAQAYDMLGMAKESLLDAILFVDECLRSVDPELSVRGGRQGGRVPDYAERLVRKQMRAAWLFREAAAKHGDEECRTHDGGASDGAGDGDVDSEWETASESEDRSEVDGNEE